MSLPGGKASVNQRLNSPFLGVIVADAGVGVENLRAAIECIFWESHRDEGRCVPEATGVENRADLPDNVLAFQFLNAVNHLRLINPATFADYAERLPNQGKIGLQDVHYLAVDGFEFVLVQRWRLVSDIRCTPESALVSDYKPANL